MLTVAILAGGLAQRMRPLTDKTPKSLIKVNGKPFIFWQLSYLATQGVKNVVICSGFLGSAIELAVGDGSQFGLNVIYSEDGNVPLGTGGALTQASTHLGKLFFVMYGDSFLPIDFAEVYRVFINTPKPSLMTVMKNEDRWDRSNTAVKNGLVIAHSKSVKNDQMKYIDYGLGILPTTTLSFQPLGNPYDLSELYTELALARELIAYEMHQRFYEIGSHSGLKETELFLKEGKYL